MCKFSLIGDSITEYNWRAGTNWPMYLEQDYGFQVQNLGISGTGFAKESPYLERVSRIDPGCDLIGVAVSFNDLHSEVDLGSPEDMDENTICGLANLFFTELKLKFPEKKIIAYIQNPWMDFRPGNPKSDSLVAEIEKICAKHKIPFYKYMYSNTGELRPWELENRKTYFRSDNQELGHTGTVDTVHPNSKGHKIIAEYMAKIFTKEFQQNKA